MIGDLITHYGSFAAGVYGGATFFRIAVFRMWIVNRENARAIDALTDALDTYIHALDVAKEGIAKRDALIKQLLDQKK